MYPTRPKQTGFTLLEVLIALLILGLVLGATSQLVATSLNNVTALETNMLGTWVAQNQISLAQLNKTPEGETSGDTEMAGRKWYWKQKIAPTPESALLEIVVEVSTDANNFENRAAIEYGFRLAP